MKFGIFYEHQLPRPMERGRRAQAVPGGARPGRARRRARHRLRLGGRAPLPRGVLALLGARSVSRRRARSAPRRIRLGHGICADAAELQPPGARRRAHRHARPRLQRRVEFGTGEAPRCMELGGFNVASAGEAAACGARPSSRCANMMVMDPYPGFKGEFFAMPCRNVVPKPVQKPHPPLLGSPAPIARPSRWRRVAASAR